MKLYISLAALALSAVNAGRVEDVQAQALNFANNNPQIKKAQKQLQKQAKGMTFLKALNTLENGLNAQLKKAGMKAGLQKELKTILSQGKTAAVKEIKNAGFKPKANIAKTAEKEFNNRKAGVKQQVLKQQQELNKLANKAVDNM